MTVPPVTTGEAVSRILSTPSAASAARVLVSVPLLLPACGSVTVGGRVTVAVLLRFAG